MKPKIKIEHINLNQRNRHLSRRKIKKISRYITIGLTKLYNVVSKIIGFFTLLFSLIFLFVFLSALFGISFISNHIKIQKWIDLILEDGRDFYLGLIGIAVFIGIPILMLIYKSLKLIFSIEYHKRWINFISGIIWLSGFFILIYISFRTGKDFSQFVKVREFVPIIQKDTLILAMKRAVSIEHDDKLMSKQNSFEFKLFGTYKIQTNKFGNNLLGFPKLSVIKSQNNEIGVLMIKESYGKDENSASMRAKHISYQIIQKDSLLIFDEFFKVKNFNKFREQDLFIILKLPVGKVVFIDSTLKYMLYDSENVNDLTSFDMINKRWMMTEQGLYCLDCQIK